MTARKFFKFLFCWHNLEEIGPGYVGYVIIGCRKCGYRKAAEL